MFVNKTKYDEFIASCEHAAELEKRGYFCEASIEWSKAAKIANTDDNKVWCINRCKFCRRKILTESES
ncbi:ANR family transcriptional regulator [Vibrio mediterranei]|uniref:ANR family transcriptional regulator n=1 Tax=Vibrio mediterranei TaxID=689 RepID=UPI0038D2079E